MSDLLQVFEETQGIIKDGCYSVGNRRIDLPLSADEIEEAQYFDERRARDLVEKPTAIVPFHESNCVVDITNCDTLDAARIVAVDEGNTFRMLRRPVLLLNFANPHVPGGGVANGARAQEEDLCRRSTLYSSITSNVVSAFYADNKQAGNYMFTDGIILSPNVVVFRGSDGELLNHPFIVSVLTCPAPFVNRLSSSDDIQSVLERRILCMLQVAASEGYDRLVLGAWGCGAFGNDPNVVAGAFYEALSGVRGRPHDCISEGPSFWDMFARITFAVLDRSAEKRNYNAFKTMVDNLQFDLMTLLNLERFNGTHEVAKDASDLCSERRITVFGAISPGDIVGMKNSTQVFEVTHVGYELDSSSGHSATFEFAGTDVDTGRQLNCFNRVDIDWIERHSES